MIYYSIGGLKVFKCQGSVFPYAARSAVPSALLAAGIRWAINKGHLDFLQAEDSIVTQTQAWTGFSVLVGFLIIFRSSQAYSRFWDGCSATHLMRADWLDACSGLISFTDNSKASADKISTFKHTLIRLVSMMHNAALMDLEQMNNKWGTMSEVKADTYELLDPMGIDEESLDAIYECNERVMLIFQWIQLLIVRNLEAGVLSVPPPIISRAYQELANGMVAFHECVKISDTPFPFPYAQNCELLLWLHWILVPFVVSQWVTQSFWAFVFVFMQVFVLWSLNYIAVEIENPFGTDDNDIDGFHMQEEMNRQLKLLLHPKTQRTPTLSKRAIYSIATDEELHWEEAKVKNFSDLWSTKEKREKRLQKLTQQSSRDALKAESHDTLKVTISDDAKVVKDEGLRHEAAVRSAPPCLPQDTPASWPIGLEEGIGPMAPSWQHSSGPPLAQCPPTWGRSHRPPAQGPPARGEGRHRSASPQPNQGSPATWERGQWEPLPRRCVSSGPAGNREAPQGAASGHRDMPQASSPSSSDEEGLRRKPRCGSPGRCCQQMRGKQQPRL